MRKLTEEFKQESERVFKDKVLYEGMDPHIVASLCADHALGLLEIADEQPDWFEAKAKS